MTKAAPLLTILLTACISILAQTPGSTTKKTQIEQEILKTERELTVAILKRDIQTAEKLVAEDFVQVVPGGIGSKATLLGYLRREPADPTLTLTTEDVQVRITGNTAITIGKRIERRRSPDNNREGTAYARYTRTYIKSRNVWQLLSEHLQPVPTERSAVQVDPEIYDDYIGKYDSPIFTFSVTKEGQRLIATPDDKRRPAAELFPESESEFFLKGRDAQIMFLRDRTGRVTHALLHMNGVPVRARRVG